MQLANLEREGASTAEEEMDIKNAMKAVNVKRAKLALDFKARPSKSQSVTGLLIV